MLCRYGEIAPSALSGPGSCELAPAPSGRAAASNPCRGSPLLQQSPGFDVRIDGTDGILRPAAGGAEKNRFSDIRREVLEFSRCEIGLPRDGRMFASADRRLASPARNELLSALKYSGPRWRHFPRIRTYQIAAKPPCIHFASIFLLPNALRTESAPDTKRSGARTVYPSPDHGQRDPLGRPPHKTSPVRITQKHYQEGKIPRSEADSIQKRAAARKRGGAHGGRSCWRLEAVRYGCGKRDQAIEEINELLTF